MMLVQALTIFLSVVLLWSVAYTYYYLFMSWTTQSETITENFRLDVGVSLIFYTIVSFVVLSNSDKLRKFVRKLLLLNYLHEKNIFSYNFSSLRKKEAYYKYLGTQLLFSLLRLSICSYTLIQMKMLYESNSPWGLFLSFNVGMPMWMFMMFYFLYIGLIIFQLLESPVKYHYLKFKRNYCKLIQE